MKPAPDASTEDRLEAAALRLLARDGVLAGLNLREVADEAKVGRGLVYHYFGTRRSLLRAALERRATRRRSTVTQREQMSPRSRLEEFFASVVQDGTDVRLLALLVLDSDEGLTALPFAGQTRAAVERDVEAGLLAQDLDIDAIQAGFLAAVYGWAVFRKSFAGSLGRDPQSLDADVLEMIHRMWSPPAAPDLLQCATTTGNNAAYQQPDRPD